ncbi:hypothetical protein ABMY26_00715 (plasmid) [Azospirillum sp. HJ39]|uniref:hypothetical protein n=1 Tax=Azospirillum sp. HJ39 TaxID=3159496 RepID=UPI003555F268
MDGELQSSAPLQQELDDLLELRRAAMRSHDGALAPGNRAALVNAAIRYRRTQGWDRNRIDGGVASIQDRLNKVFRQ